jgi:anti-sigma regulatory factor (Ser/Thr protein kinase)
VEAVGPWLTAADPADLRWIRVEDASAAVGCRNAAVALAQRLAFPPARAEQLAVAVTEAAGNLAKHARAGTLMLRADHAGPGIDLVTLDAGPGIADVPAALRDGMSTAGTLGIGLGAIRRLADFCHVYSPPGRGTVLAARFLARPETGPAGRAAHRDWGGVTRPIGGETECGDSYVARRDGAVVTGLLCDGLGHGPLAAAASREAIAVLRETPGDEPAALLRRAHQRMGHTRGGAVAVVRVSPQGVSFAGLGNVAAWIVSGDARQGMISVPGIAGHQARKISQFEYQAVPGAAVVLHSDGLSSRWNPRDLPGLERLDPLVIAAALLREAGGHRDDASVLVLAQPVTRPGPAVQPGPAAPA